jgi:hypothetical protein
MILKSWPFWLVVPAFSSTGRAAREAQPASSGAEYEAVLSVYGCCSGVFLFDNPSPATFAQRRTLLLRIYNPSVSQNQLCLMVT